MKRTMQFMLALAVIPVGVDAQVTPSASCADIGSRDVSKVMDMDSIFFRAPAFNHHLSGWCVSLITSKLSPFASGIDAINLPVGETCPS
jgi:hypothetical protein